MSTLVISDGTARLLLSRPTDSDVPALFAINSDPRVWSHFPALRHTEPSQTAALVRHWRASWDDEGLGAWTIRRRADDRVIGYGGCTVRDGVVWNLGYRLAADEHGQGFATELARTAALEAHRVGPDRPVIAFLLEHNIASGRVAEKVGLTLVHRGADAGNPDASAVRLVYADRALTTAQLAAAMR